LAQAGRPSSGRMPRAAGLLALLGAAMASTTTTTTTTVTTTLDTIETIEADIDAGAKVLTRIMDLIFLVIIIVGIVVVCKLQPGILGQINIRPGKFLRYREFKGCLQSVTCGCCGLLKSMNVSDLDVPKQILQVTCVGLYKAAGMDDIYLQVSTDEIPLHKGHSEFTKNGRINHVVGGTADLRAEKIEFDWYGDEPGVMVVIRAASAVKASEFHAVVGQLFVPNAQVVKYAEIAKSQSAANPVATGNRATDPANKGAISFAVKPPGWMSPDSDTAKMNAMQSTIFGQPPKTIEEELDDLRRENENLRRQIQGQPPLPEAPAAPPVELGQLVLKFELQESKYTRVAHDDHGMYRAASFDVETGDGYNPMQSTGPPRTAGGTGTTPLTAAAGALGGGGGAGAAAAMAMNNPSGAMAAAQMMAR